MTLAGFWKTIAERIAQGERNEAVLVDDAYRMAEDRGLVETITRQTITKRIRDLISASVKPTGQTSRVPAGQQDLGWADLQPLLALSRLRAQIKQAYAAQARARIHAEIVGVIDASGLDPTTFETFGELMQAAHVPGELQSALVA